MMKMIKIINMTPHEITFIHEGKKEIFESQGIIRVNETITRFEELDGKYPIIRKDLEKVDTLPEEKEDTIYIVSFIAMKAIKEQTSRNDFLMIGETIRDEKGRIVGCKSFATI